MAASVEPGSSGPADPSPAGPPIALLSVEGGEAVEGQLGSFTWLEAGSDAPWLDGSPIHVGAGERLSLTYAEPIVITSWTARRVPPGNRDDSGAVVIGKGSGAPVAFNPPPSGSWSVNVTVSFSNNRGSAAYFWLVDVD